MINFDKKKWKDSKFLDILFVVLFSICVCAYAFQVCIPRGFTDDDWGIANYFAGVLDPEYATPYNKFISVLLGWAMYAMYQMFPGPNWFVIIEEAIVVISFMVIQYMLIRKLRKQVSFIWAYFYSAAFVLSIEQSFVCRTQFSQTAIVGSITGVLLILFSYGKNKAGVTGGIALAVISCLYRPGGFELILPFIGICLLFGFWSKREGKSLKKHLKSWLRDQRNLLAILGILCVFCLAVIRLNTAIFNSDYYKEYNEFNAARASVLDYAKAPYEDIAEGLAKIGVSPNDYTLITSWTIADKSFITTELLQEIAKLEPRSSATTLPTLKEIQEYFLGFKNEGNVYNGLFFMMLIILAGVVILDFRHMAITAPVFAVITIAIEIYFRARFPSYIRTGLLYTVIVTALFLTDFSVLGKLRGKWLLHMAIGTGIFVILFPLGNKYFNENKGVFQYNMDGLAMYQYMNGRSEDVFIIPTGDAGGLPSLRDSYSIFQETQPGIYRHTVGLGGWSTNMPWINELYSKWGIDYPMRQIADSNVYLLASSVKLSDLQQYVLEHDQKETTASLTAVEYGTTIYKVTDRELPIIEKEFALIENASIAYDSVYDTYDIQVDFECKNVSGDHARLFIVLTDNMDNNGYYMVYGGHDMPLSVGEGNAVAKIPSYAIVGGVFRVNLMVQWDDGNCLNTGDSVELQIPFVPVQ